MPRKLGTIEGQRRTFCGTFKQYGFKNNWLGFPEKTVLLVNITDANGKTLTDHLWFNFTKQFQMLGELKEGDRIQFDARVKTYIKGYVNYRDMIDERTQDYRLSHPTKVRKLQR